MNKTREMMKRFVSLLLALMLVLSLAPTAFALELGEEEAVQTDTQEAPMEEGTDAPQEPDTDHGTEKGEELPEEVEAPGNGQDTADGEEEKRDEGENAPDPDQEPGEEDQLEAVEEAEEKETMSEEESEDDTPMAETMTMELYLDMDGAEYHISSVEDLEQFRDNVNKGYSYEGVTVYLETDIVLSGKDWTPIGDNADHAFAGIFDGQSFSISGLYIDTNKGYQGLFGYVGSGIVENLSVSGEILTTGNYAAGIAGYNEKGTIRNCYSSVTVTCAVDIEMADRAEFVGYHAGIAGYNGGLVEACVNEGAITGITAIGGIVGQNVNPGIVQSCYNTGEITGSANHIGGVVGQNQKGTVSHSYNIGTVKGAVNVGAVIGQQSNATFVNCYYLETSAPFLIGSTEEESGKMSAQEMGEAAVVAALNEDGVQFALDRQKVNGGYPIFYWQVQEGDAPGFQEASEASWEIARYIEGAITGTKERYYPDEASILGNFAESSTGTDWTALMMGRYGFYDTGTYYYLYDDGTGYQDFLETLEDYVTKTYEAKGGGLDESASTEWHRVTLAIQALGGDPTAFGTYQGKAIDLVADGAYNHPSPGWQGINGWIYGLIAMDTLRYEVPAGASFQREDFIKAILALQISDGVNGNSHGGWGIMSWSSEPDMSAMAIQALAPYYNDDTVYTYVNSRSGETLSKSVSQVVNEALDRLGDLQLSNGDFSLWGDVNSESTAQVLLALVALGIDPVEDPRFIKGDNTLLDGLLKYQLSDGTFSHSGSQSSRMATDQAGYALVGYWRYLNGMRSLYDFREDWSGATRSAIAKASAAIEGLPDSSDTNYKKALKAALVLFRTVPSDEQRYVYNYADLRAAIDMVGGESALGADEPYLKEIAVTTQPTKLRYYEQERFDPDGMVLTGYYSDGETEVISEYSWTPNGPLTLKDGQITIHYLTHSLPLDITVAAAPWTGGGTKASPFLIEEAEDLFALYTYVNTEGNSTYGRYWKLTENINLSGRTWQGIGTSTRPFQGNLDGDYHVIRDLNISGGSNQGLFAYAGGAFAIENLGIESGTVSGTNFLGAFVGSVKENAQGETAVIRNCWNGASVTATGGYSGGLVGSFRERATLTIENCYNTGNVTGGTDGSIGGIIGDAITGDAPEGEPTPTITIRNCYNTGSIIGSSNVGGIAGWLRCLGTVENCYNIGAIEAEPASGGIVGSLIAASGELMSVKNCHYQTEGKLPGIGNATGGAAGKSAAELKAAAFLSVLGAAFQADFNQNINGGYPIHAWQTDTSSGGGGTGTVVTDTIETNLVSRETYKGSVYTFFVRARNETGDKIPSSVTLNGVSVPQAWDDSDMTSYTLHFTEEGKQTIMIKAGSATETFTITYVAAKSGEVIGQVTLAVEGFSFGGGYVVEPILIDIKEGENGAVLLAEGLERAGYGYTNTGSLEAGFYLEAITGTKLEALPTDLSKTPDYLKTKLEADRDINYSRNDRKPNSLGEFDFTNGSGWMYCVNGFFPNVGFTDHYFTDGDVLRVQFTLAYGADIGGTNAIGASGKSYYAVANKDELTLLIARYGVDNVSKQALSTMAKLDATADEVRDAIKNILPEETEESNRRETTVSLRVASKDGTAEVLVSTEEITAAIQEMQASENTDALVLRVEVQGEVNQVTVRLEKESLMQLSAVEGADLRIETPLASGSIGSQSLLALLTGMEAQFALTFETTGEGDLTLTLIQDHAIQETIPGGVFLSVQVKAIGGLVPSAATVLALVGGENELQVLSQTTYGEEALGVTVAGSCTVQVLENRQEYGDVTSVHWAFDVVSYVAAREILEGSEGLFSPQDAVQYAMLLNSLLRLEYNGAVGAEDTVAGSDEAITREGAAMMLYSYAQRLGLNTAHYDYELQFIDMDQVSQEAKEALDWAVGTGLFQGDDRQALRPTDVATRAELSALLQRFVQSQY